MNREQKRKTIKQLKHKGYSLQDIEQILEIRNSRGIIPNGAKVKLNYNKITSLPDYEKSLPEYKSVVESFKDKLLTVEYDEKYGDNPNLVCIKEDTSDIKWLFHVYNLILVEVEK